MVETCPSIFIDDRVRAGVMDHTGVTLKISIQRDYNTFLYGAFPLCVILANNMSPWYLERYVQVYSYYGDEYDWPVFDMCDSFAYSEVLDTATLDRTSFINGDIIDFVRTEINAGFYATIFVDMNYLNGHESTISPHEYLVYGYDDAAGELAIVGFAADRRFTKLCVDYDLFRAAFDRAIAAMAPDGGFSFMTSPVQLLRPRPRSDVFNLENLIARLRGYRDSAPVVPPVTSTQNAYWWLRDQPIWSPAATGHDERIRFGLAVYDDLDRYLSRAGNEAERPGVSVDYRVFHLLYEHKQSVMQRLRFVADFVGGPPRLLSLLADWNGLVREVNALRLHVLRGDMVDKPDIPPRADMVLRKVRAAEGDLLDALFDQLDRIV